MKLSDVCRVHPLGRRRVRPASCIAIARPGSRLPLHASIAGPGGCAPTSCFRLLLSAFALLSMTIFCCLFCVFFFVFCLLVVLAWLSVPVQVTDWKDLSQKWMIYNILIGTLNPTHSPGHSLELFSRKKHQLWSVTGKLPRNVDATAEVHFAAQKCAVSEKLWTGRFLQDDRTESAPVDIFTERRSSWTLSVCDACLFCWFLLV